MHWQYLLKKGMVRLKKDVNGLSRDKYVEMGTNSNGHHFFRVVDTSIWFRKINIWIGHRFENIKTGSTFYKKPQDGVLSTKNTKLSTNIVTFNLRIMVSKRDGSRESEGAVRKHTKFEDRERQQEYDFDYGEGEGGVGVEYVLEKGVHCDQRLTDVPPSYVVSLLEELYTDTEKLHTTLTSFIRGAHLGPEQYTFDFAPHRGQNLHDVPVPYEMYVDRSTVLDVIITFETGKICKGG